ncbi:dTDP-4-amino-4,6-dideoxygalactose transaminase [Delftia sp. 60]|uniref:DegT/DnrJ/EryC1/StrS family aminotransferase n=1 Tax=Delftia sp. 60 TaxID=2035216 RepID=UPI000C53ED1B|nr:DegT/DnrJ/EryC1/StrS family aminotransferase [Delftia sp. 60]PIF34908.1 dTDP-4-amino-4,6-dideoxygalactose transaminase [Burkholderiales bacterium 23]PIF64309.1 dTDP-4-amino-4,6-dideoxygalactose transaminase [Delftia sp. 60]
MIRNGMDVLATSEWVPLLVPDMPSPQQLMPWLERMHASRHYSNFGPLVDELEAEFAQRFEVSVENLTTVANATLGLELVLQALDLPAGSRILLPAFTFVATATAILRVGHVPIIADVDASNWMLTPDIAAEACARTQVDAVMPVATFGMPHDMHAWHQFEEQAGVPVVIDAAASYGSQWLQGARGTLVFSLHTTKSLPAAEGGLVVSTRDGLAEKVRELSNFGINLKKGHSVQIGALASLGTNAKLSEYHAAIGLASLSFWESHAQQRRLLEAQMKESLTIASRGALRWQTEGGGGALKAPTLLCARLSDENARMKLEKRCEEARITTRRWYQPLLHLMPALISLCEKLETPNADSLSGSLLGLPFFLRMQESHRLRIIDAVRVE